jgi:serine/threonine protein kinase
LSDLESKWGPLQFPVTVDITQLEFVLQLHDSVCLVKLDGKLWIMKALANHTKYMYHELRHLLSIPPHVNVVSQPCHLVTKRCAFGGKVAVVGFTLEYHEYGSLRDLVPFLSLHGITTERTALRWSSELASALTHLREHTGSFYPDLRLDNIVLSADGRVVMVDFEQRGVWCEFAAPEVNALDYMRIIATDEDTDPSIRKKYADLLEEQLPGWSDLEDGEEYRWPSTGYNVAWKCLTPIEQEACEVYMLGRVIWCLFEGHSAPQRAAVWISYRWEPLIEFPEYVRTPLPIRELIDRCTRGRTPGLGKVITREGNRLVLRALEGNEQSTPGLVQDTARKWWRAELEKSERWLHDRSQGLSKGTWKENFYERPTLRQVLEYLQACQTSIGTIEDAPLATALKDRLGPSRA